MFKNPPLRLQYFKRLQYSKAKLISWLRMVGQLVLTRRAFGLSHLAALLAAIGYMATPRLISHLGAGHLTIFQTVTWFPWLALSCWATVREPRRWGALLGICIAMTLLAGHPQ